MGPVFVIALGAGAIVTTVAAGAVLLRRRLLGQAVDIDLEKGPAENIMERRETGPGWKEFTEVDEKGPYELLMPLVAALSPREIDVTDANTSRMPLSPLPRLPALHQSPDPSTPNVQRQVGPVPVLEGDISDTHAPVFPPGLPVPAKLVAVVAPIPARLGPISALNPLDTSVTGITSWPVLVPTPVEDMRAKANGQGELTESDIKDDVVPPDKPSDISLESCELEIALNGSSVPTVSGLTDDSEEAAHSPRSEVSLDQEGVSQTGSPQSVVIALDDPGPILESSAVEFPDAIDAVPALPILCAGPNVTIPDTALPANIALLESLVMSPKTVSPGLFHTLPLDSIVSTRVVFGEALPLSIDVSDPEPSFATEAPFVPVLAPIVTTYLQDTNEAPLSPLSDAGSSSSEYESSGPDTPTELKHNLPFSPTRDFPSKATLGLQLPFCLPSEDVTIDEDMEIVDDFVIVGHQAPDPPSPTIDTICTQLKTPKFPGGFGDVMVASSEQKLVGPSALIEGPPLTADMVQLCNAVMAVSNCAGLVAQAVIGFSMWWSLTLVPA